MDTSLVTPHDICILELVPLAESSNSVVRQWHIETPAPGDKYPRGSEIPVRGWALASREQEQSSLHVVLRLKDRTLSLPLSEERPDVVEIVCKANPEGHPYLRSGFQFQIDATEAAKGFEIGFETDGRIFPVASIRVA